MSSQITGQGAQPNPTVAKSTLRDQLTTARRRRSPAALSAATSALAERVLGLEEVRRAACVSVYVSVGEEPGTGPLLDALLMAGKRVLLPLTVRETVGSPAGRGSHLDLDWAAYEGPDSLAPALLAPASFGLLEPVTPPLGRDAIATADVLLVPGMGVSASGYRIGKGAGCYDRALTRASSRSFACVLLFDDEVDQDVPVEPHDQPVNAVATPGRLNRFPV